MKVLIDTNIISLTNLIEALRHKGAEILIAKATRDREACYETRGESYDPFVETIEVAPETFVFGESTFSISFGDNEKLLEIIRIISSGSFPTGNNRITEKQRNQLRDAMIFESSLIRNCDYFCTNDRRAFIKHGKREILEKEFGIRIRLPEEILSEFCL